MSAVRLAIPADRAPLLDLLRLKHAEDGIGGFDPLKADAAVAQGLTCDRALIGVIRSGARVEASVGLFVTSPWDSTDEFLADRWLFVHPDHRRSEHAKKLMDFARWTARQLGRSLLMTAVYNEATAGKAMLFDRSLPMRGSVYLFDPSADTASAVIHRANQLRMIHRVEFSTFAAEIGVDRLDLHVKGKLRERRARAGEIRR